MLGGKCSNLLGVLLAFQILQSTWVYGMDCPTSGNSFSSPNYPSKYPAGSSCVYENNQTSPSAALVGLTRLQLKEGDTLTFEHPYGPAITKHGKSKKRTYYVRLPAFFRATFSTTSGKEHKGFYATVAEYTGKCHGTVDPSTSGHVGTPKYPNKHWKQTICEWKFTGTVGKTIMLVIEIERVRCGKNYIAIDESPYDSFEYDSSSITTYCGKGLTKVFISTSNEISIFYYGKYTDKGFRVDYLEI